MKTFKKLIIVIAALLILLPAVFGCSTVPKTKEVYISLVPGTYYDIGGDAFNYKINGTWVADYNPGLNHFSGTIVVEVFQTIHNASKKIMTVYLEPEELKDGNCISSIYEIWGPRDERTQEITITIQDSKSGERKIASVTI